MNELSENLMCIQMRTGIEIWIEKKRVANMIAYLASNENIKLFEFEGRLLNKADLVGVFTPLDMEEATRRRNGQWKCKFATWHERKAICECRPPVDIWKPPVEEVSQEQRQANLVALAKLKEQIGKRI